MKNNKIAKSKTKTLPLLFLFTLIFSLLSVKTSYAIPVPHGIDGTIYDLDGITTADRALDISFFDMSTGEYVQGKTRTDGRYFVSLNGNNGNIIFIKIWNEYNSINATIELQGVMHNVDFLFNMTLPKLPATIEPNTIIYEEQQPETEKNLMDMQKILTLSNRDTRLNIENIKNVENIKSSGPSEQYILSGIIHKNILMQANEETIVRIINTQTQEIVETRTGIGRNSGAFYAIIKGSLGEQVIIDVPEYNTETSVILQGDMKNLNLNLNNIPLETIVSSIIIGGLLIVILVIFHNKIKQNNKNKK